MGTRCPQNENSSATCLSPTGMLRLFGVQLETSGAASAMKKCFSTESLGFIPPSSPSPSPSSSLLSIDEASAKISCGYLSDGLVARTQERRKGVPWTEEEHKLFLAGLEKLGKGDWRGISRRFVTTRTPTQVASHAQKYFLRQNSLNKKKRRSSLFDVVSSCEIAAQLDASPLSCVAAVHNSSDQEQETQLLPSCVGLMQNCTLSTCVQPCPMDLDLSISTTGTKCNHEASPGLSVLEII